MSQSPEAYNAEILGTLKSLVREVSEIKGMLLVLSSGPVRSTAPAGGGSHSSVAPRGEAQVASDYDLDGPHGDPLIKFDPKEKYWKGPSFANYKFSETNPEYLDAMAKYLEACAYMASQDADEKKRKSGTYKAKDAARARGWAARLRAGYAPQAPAQTGGGGGADYDGSDSSFDSAGADDDIPFLVAESRWWTP